MKKLLIIYATTEGQTAKIVLHLEKRAISSGVEVTAYNVIEYPPSPKAYDMVILAGSVHMMKYQDALIHYATKHAGELNAMPNAFVSVSMAAAHFDEETHQETDKWVAGFEQHTGWKPQQVEHVAGALKYVEYNWLKRMVMREIARRTGESTDTTQDHEYTDWNQLDRFMDGFVSRVSKLP